MYEKYQQRIKKIGRGVYDITEFESRWLEVLHGP